MFSSFECMNLNRYLPMKDAESYLIKVIILLIQSLPKVDIGPEYYEQSKIIDRSNESYQEKQISFLTI